MVEPFPFILCEQVYIDSFQYELFSNRNKLKAFSEVGGYAVAPEVADVLREFERAKILKPVDYAGLVASRIGEVIALAESVLVDPDLAIGAADSRELWAKFLVSRGGVFHPNWKAEISGMSTVANDYSGFIPGRDIGHFGDLPIAPVAIPKAAFMCGHDVFDAATVLKVAEILHAAICDWQMYGPLYRRCISTGHAPFAPLGSSSASTTGAQWFIPMPQFADIDSLWAARDDSWIKLLRREIDGTLPTALPVRSPKALFDMRREVSSRLNHFFVNSYSAMISDEQRIFVERPSDGQHDAGDEMNDMAQTHVEINHTIEKEQKLVGEVFSICADAGQIFHHLPFADWGIDGDIELVARTGQPTAHRLFVQLKSGDSHLRRRESDGAEFFKIKNSRHALYWRTPLYPVLLIHRNSKGLIRWMDIRDELRRLHAAGSDEPSEVRFTGEIFDSSGLLRIRDAMLRSLEFPKDQ